MGKVCIAYKRSDGGVSIVHPYLECGLTLEQIIAKDVPAGAEQKIMDTDDLQDRSFRDAWEFHKDDGIAVSLDKAKEITKERLRSERAPLLEAQDVEFTKAIEAGSDFTLIVAEKQRLRDITQLAETATTLEELKSITAAKASAVVEEEPITP